MTTDEAESLARWVKDHDTRFEAKAIPDGDDADSAHVLLTRPADSTPEEPVRSLAEYGTRYIEPADPGPTIRAAWERFRGTD